MRQRCSILLLAYCLGAGFVLPDLAKQVALTMALERVANAINDFRGGAAMRNSLLQSKLQEEVRVGWGRGWRRARNGVELQSTLTPNRTYLPRVSRSCTMRGWWPAS